MKKIILILACAVAMTACGGNRNQNETAVENFRAQEQVARAIYDKFVLGYDMSGDITEYFTPSYLLRLYSANEYDENIDYALWYLRTGYQDGDGESKVTRITAVNDSTVSVEYLDMGHRGRTQLVFVNVDGRWLVNEALNPQGEPVIP